MRELGGTSNHYSGDGCWRVRLFQGGRRDAPPLGAGVLLPGGLVLTCAHVVLAARRPAAAGGRPAGPPVPLPDVYAEFPAALPAGHRPVAAQVLTRHLRPPTAQFGADIALLRLAEEPPVEPAVLHRQVPALGERVHTVGYPKDLPGGEHITARLMGRGGPGRCPEWVQLDPETAPYVVRHGFSGSGVVHARTRGVIGILVHQHGTVQFPVPSSHAYMIPTDTVLGHLADEQIKLHATGARAVSGSIRLVPGAADRDQALGLGRWIARWLGDGGAAGGPATCAGTVRGTCRETAAGRAAGTVPGSRAGTDTGIRAGTDSGARAGTGKDPYTGARRETSAYPDGSRGAPTLGRGCPAGAAEPVELAFVADGDAEARSVLHSALVLADRERGPWSLRRGRATEPRAGSVDLALDATGWTAEKLVRRTAARAGVPERAEPPDTTDAMTARIAEQAPPLSAAFLSVDRVRSSDGEIMALLHALLARGHSRLLLVFRDPSSSLLARVVGELLDEGWADRHEKAVAARLNVLAGLESRHRRPPTGQPAAACGHVPVQPRLAGRLAALRQGGTLRNSADAAYQLFRVGIDVEEALQRLDRPRAPRGYVVLPPGDGLTDLPHVTVGDPDALVEPEPPPDLPPPVPDPPLPVPDSPLPTADPPPPAAPGQAPGAYRPYRPPDTAPETALAPTTAPAPTTTSTRRNALVRGQLLHQQYQVVGRLGQGSYGQVYLARDRMLAGRPVALKGVHDPDDEQAVKNAVQERLRLVGLNHPSIIKVFNYAKGPGSSEDQLSFIVMEFADGAPLRWVAEQIEKRVEPFHDHRVYEFIAAYGLLVLDALTYLHEERGLVYGDLSLTNVIHCGAGIKLVDVAAVRPIGTSGPVTYPAPEAHGAAGLTVAGDLFAAGAVLEELVARVPEAPPGLGTQSLRRVLNRATGELPEERFATAREMSVQLRGVLRELRSLRLGEEAAFEPSTLFAPVPAALDGELGKAPPLGQWRTGGNVKRALRAEPPFPAEVALGLPVPKPSVADGNWTELHRTSYDDPVGLLQLSDAWKESPEKALLHCRLHLEIARDHPEEAVAERAAAEAELARARTSVGELAEFDWRLYWHEGLLHLVHDRVDAARACFDLVNEAIPGEYAPKLALGYCHEVLADPKEAVALYGAVWHRNHALGGAAFGLARIHLATGKPQLALDCLEAVPADSRHRTAARTAMVRILAAPPADGSPPTVAAARQAWVALHRLTRKEGLTDRHAQDRLRADLQELLLLLVTTAPAGALPGPLEAFCAEPDIQAEKIPVPPTEDVLRDQLAACYRRLLDQMPPAERARDRDLAKALLDNSYHTRPMGTWHRRGDQAPRRRDRWKRFRLDGGGLRTYEDTTAEGPG
ncbi:tetratricopeptide repeat protein [Streptomyces monomycini]|uniref:tetratricopeptide repeat protein n=1 Tax=Streptomyces monomycini TaxID=371720 RepID=UPI0009963452|nr:tetratricopeptide repeat protein [Streptomyces monomycini]